jgi:hypothetical protein
VVTDLAARKRFDRRPRPDFWGELFRAAARGLGIPEDADSHGGPG